MRKKREKERWRWSVFFFYSMCCEYLSMCIFYFYLISFFYNLVETSILFQKLLKISEKSLLLSLDLWGLWCLCLPTQSGSTCWNAAYLLYGMFVKLFVCVYVIHMCIVCASANKRTCYKHSLIKKSKGGALTQLFTIRKTQMYSLCVDGGTVICVLNNCKRPQHYTHSTRSTLPIVTNHLCTMMFSVKSRKPKSIEHLCICMWLFLKDEGCVDGLTLTTVDETPHSTHFNTIHHSKPTLSFSLNPHSSFPDLRP